MIDVHDGAVYMLIGWVAAGILCCVIVYLGGLDRDDSFDELRSFMSVTFCPKDISFNNIDKEGVVICGECKNIPEYDYIRHGVNVSVRELYCVGTYYNAKIKCSECLKNGCRT